MQGLVQKSTSTTFPRSDLLLRGAELSQPIAPPKSGSGRVFVESIFDSRALAITPIATTPVVTAKVRPPRIQTSREKGRVVLTVLILQRSAFKLRISQRQTSTGFALHGGPSFVVLLYGNVLSIPA